MRVTSPSFEHKGMIPDKFTCKGENINPAIVIEDIPKATKSMVLIVDDPDAPSGVFVHWVVYNIPVTGRIEEDSVPGEEIKNSFSKKGYGGPCPPSGVHRYYFRLYALDEEIDLAKDSTLDDLKKAMGPHVLAEEQVVGLYGKD